MWINYANMTGLSEKLNKLYKKPFQIITQFKK